MKLNQLKRLSLPLACSATLLLAGCYGNGDGGTAANADDDYQFIAETSPGIYRSVLQKNDGDVALVRAYLSADGNVFVALEEDDTEQATALYKTQTQSADALLQQLKKVLPDGTLSPLTRSEESDLATSLDDLQGKFSSSTAAGMDTLTINSDGSVSLSGTCEANGNISSTAENVNLYKLVISGDCGNYTAFAHLSSLESEFDVLHMISSGDNARFDKDFFRI
ncbi:MAG: hypothetical protein HRU20_09565 [Pseudomonadales bacterium]|nr:hypothetical protein [Pseudomonadales bacterium]